MAFQHPLTHTHCILFLQRICLEARHLVMLNEGADFQVDDNSVHATLMKTALDTFMRINNKLLIEKPPASHDAVSLLLSLL